MYTRNPAQMMRTSSSWVAVWRDYRRLALVAQAGRSVIVFEQASDIGGRAATQRSSRYFFQSRATRFVLPGPGVPADAGTRGALHGRVPESGRKPPLDRSGDYPLPRGLVSLVRLKAVQPSRERAVDSAS